MINISLQHLLIYTNDSNCYTPPLCTEDLNSTESTNNLSSALRGLLKSIFNARRRLNITEVHPSFISFELTYSGVVILCTGKICTMNVFLNLTNGSHLPKGMIAHNCQFRKFCRGIDKGQLGYQVFCMTAIYFSLTPCNFNVLVCTAKNKLHVWSSTLQENWCFLLFLVK